MYSSVFWCLLSCFFFFFFVGGGEGGALLHINHYSKAGHFDLAGYWTSHNKNAIFSAKIQFTAMFFSPQEENLLFLSGSSAQKSLIISPSNWPFVPDFKACLAFLQYLWTLLCLPSHLHLRFETTPGWQLVFTCTWRVQGLKRPVNYTPHPTKLRK